MTKVEAVLVVFNEGGIDKMPTRARIRRMVKAFECLGLSKDEVSELMLFDYYGNQANKGG